MAYGGGSGSSGSTSGQSSGYSSSQNTGGGGTTGRMGGTLTIIFVLGILWGIGALVAGIYFAAVGGAFFFFTGPLVVAVGVILILSGLCAFITCMRIYKLEKHSEACTFLLIGSILALISSILGGIVGIVFYFLLKNERGRFSS